MLRRLALAALLALPARPQWTPEHQVQVRTFRQVRPAPGGKRVAFVAMSPVMTADRSEFVSRIHLAEGGRTRPLTPEDASAWDPQWSRDGRLAFLSGPHQISVRDGDAEPACLVKVPGTLGTIAWSPDGRSIAFTMTDPATPEEERAARARDDARWHQENLKLARLYVVRADPGRAEPRLLTPRHRQVIAFHWSPDGTRLVFSHGEAPGQEAELAPLVSVLDVATGRELFGDVPAGERAFPRYSPDGAWIAFTQHVGRPRFATHTRLVVMPAGGGPIRPLPETADGQPVFLGWWGQRLLFLENRGTLDGIFAQDVRTGEVVRLDHREGLVGAPSLDPAGEYLGFGMENVHQAPEAHVTTLAEFNPRPVSALNAGLPAFPLGRTEVIRWTSTDGKEIEGLLTYPTSYRPGQRVPLLLFVHGGPMSVFKQSFIAQGGIYPNASFAARGFAMLRPNPRGSAGYGWPFRIGNEKDWGGQDCRDVLAGVDHVIAMGVADPERLGVMGWSYGGFLAAWLTTQTPRFKAASIGAAITEPASFNGTTDIPSFGPDYLGGDAWEIPETYARTGVMARVGKVGTPCLIQHCEGDVRVPISQGYELYNALKRRGVEVRMLVIPRQAHVAREPRAQLKVMGTNLDWFTRKLLGKAAP